MEQASVASSLDNAVLVRAVAQDEWRRVLACGEPFFRERNLPGVFDPEKALRTWTVLSSVVPTLIVAAFEGPQILGAIGRMILSMDWSAHEYTGEAFWYVLPAYRNKFVGVRMLALADQWARNQGVKDFRLGAFHGEDFERSEHVYGRLGYHPYTTTFRKVEE